MSFSERMGYQKKRPIQIESMDSDLCNSLFNVARNYLLLGLSSGGPQVRELFKKRFNLVWSDFFKFPLHNSPMRYTGDHGASEFIYKFFNTSSWNRIYDFVEFLIGQAAELSIEFNKVLEREVAGYRILNGIVVPISDAAQIDAISVALESSSIDPLRGAHDHLSRSLQLLSDRAHPDYRNSIKEAISAIESAASILSGAAKPELKDALRVLEGKGKLHPALRGAFNQLYGWTSDEDGVRHALMEESALDFADAQFMLVTCSAFIHYIIAKAS
jgi:hypothetical protein